MNTELKALLWLYGGFAVAIIVVLALFLLAGCAHYPPQSIDDLGGCSVSRKLAGGC